MATRLHPEIKEALHDGLVIPAHPLALDKNRQLDEERQRILTRYYIDSGAGGIAVGVHTTQFDIRKPEHNLFRLVLQMAADEVEQARLSRPFVKVAGICGSTSQALEEAKIAKELGYDLGLVSLGGLSDCTEEELIKHLEAVAEIIPVFGFYLQPSVGGRLLSYQFWKSAADIPGVMAIKIAPFNRYQTLDVVRAVCHSHRRDEIALYTGNDDNIIVDLLTAYRFKVDGNVVEKRIAGGLLGHWAVWTKKAVELLEEVKKVRNQEKASVSYEELLTRNVEVTDANGVFFDQENRFFGCIPGIHEVLRRQGLLEGRWCLDPHEELSPGQIDDITRVYEQYPHLNDDDFVAQNKSKWMKGNTVY